MRSITGVLLASALALGCAPPSSVAPERAPGSSVTWSDSAVHRFVGTADYTRCGNLVHVWLRPDRDRRPFAGVQVTISPLRDRADTVVLNADFGARRADGGWAHVSFYGDDGGYLGAVAGWLSLEQPEAEQIGGYVAGRLVRFDSRTMRADTLGDVAARFVGGRSREREKIVYQMMTCPPENGVQPAHMGA